MRHPPSRRLPALVTPVLAVALLSASCEASNGGSPKGAEPVASREAASPTPAPPDRNGPSRSPEATPSTPTPTAEPLPSDTGAIPRRPPQIARLLTSTYDALDQTMRTWLEAGGDPRTQDGKTIERYALLQQKTFRMLVRHPRVGREVLDLLPARWRTPAFDTFAAGRALTRNLEPVEPPIELKTYRPESPHALLGFHKASSRRSGIPWQVLAAINLVETRFGRVLGPSSAGALGPMQFLPSTWDRYGNGGNINDARDSILAAGRFLRDQGGLQDLPGALYSYNNSDDYVKAILGYAAVMKRDPLTFYSFYNWQVFVRTTKGDVQLTGPGADR